MRVEFDVGNTRLKWRILNREGVADRGFLSHEQVLSGGLDFLPMDNVEQIVVSSVANDLICEEIRKTSKSKGLYDRLIFISASKEMSNVRFAYKDVSRLGVDRCLAMVAAYQLHNKGVLVLDCGSAITADFVDIAGQHLGGYILPGIKMMKDTLLSGTAKVFVHAETDLDISPGQTTEQCVEHGRYFQVFSLVRGLIEKAESYGIVNVCITGGDGKLVAELTGRQSMYHPDLVFDGMACVAPVGC